jgi:hypothetical protein
MLLSLEKKFLFVHVPKTAGSSITTTLTPYSLPKSKPLSRRITSHIPFPESAAKVYLRQHDTALHIKRKLGRIQFEDLCKFAVVRNPYEHAASYYRFLCQRPDHRHHQRTADLTFVQFLERRAQNARPMDQSSFLVDRSGQFLVDHILRFEILSVGFSKLCCELDIPYSELPFKNSTQNRALDAFYCTKSQSLVERIYQRDFDNFGYKFPDTL